VKNNISKSPKDILNIELFKPVRKKCPTRRFEHRGIDDTWQIDIYVFYRPKGKSKDPSYKVPVPNKARSKIRPTNDIDLVIEISKYTTT
jgi:hypothetical protein